jgi:hypothetical protein
MVRVSNWIPIMSWNKRLFFTSEQDWLHLGNRGLRNGFFGLHRQDVIKTTTFRKLILLPSSGEMMAKA